MRRGFFIKVDVGDRVLFVGISLLVLIGQTLISSLLKLPGIYAFWVSVRSHGLTNSFPALGQLVLDVLQGLQPVGHHQLYPESLQALCQPLVGTGHNRNAPL